MDYAAEVLKKEKIAVPKQSTFIGSHRYYRGQVLKVLLEKKKITRKELKKLFKKDDEEWLTRLLLGLQEEGFIIVTKDIIELQT